MPRLIQQAYEKLGGASGFTASDILPSADGAKASTAVVTPGPQGYVSAVVDPCALEPGAEYKVDLVVTIENPVCTTRPPRVWARRTGPGPVGMDEVSHRRSPPLSTGSGRHVDLDHLRNQLTPLGRLDRRDS